MAPSRKPGTSAALPAFIPPQLATLADKAPAGDEWVHQIKLDGYRTAARLEAGKVRMLTRSGLDWTARFRPIAEALAVPKIRAAYLNGEIAVLTADAASDFGALQEALGRHGGCTELVYAAFGLLHLDGRDLRPLPLIERKAILEKLIVTAGSGSRRLSGCEDRVAKEVRREKPR
jgi:bifunctional non-homologous end joining protein LigD